MIYQVQATLTFHTTDQAGLSTQIVKQLPTFYLDSEIQGILDIRHAEKIAREVVTPFELEYEHIEAAINIIPKDPK